MEQWSEVKSVEFWQPANDNIGAVSVVLDVGYKLRIAHSCRAVLVFIHRQCVNKKQPIMRTEDRLFDRGWARSAMATRKCGNKYFPKYFMAVRPFFTRIFFQKLFGLEGSRNFLEKFR